MAIEQCIQFINGKEVGGAAFPVDNVEYVTSAEYSASVSGSTIGGRVASVSVPMTKTGYTLIGATLVDCAAASALHYTPMITSGGVEVNIYLAANSASQYKFKVRGIFLKN